MDQDIKSEFFPFTINLKIIVLYLFAIELFDCNIIAVLKVDVDKIKIEIII